jgi:RNA polymerase sigma factor (sigma-70 family)
MGEAPIYKDPNSSIIERCQDGDKKAFRELYDLYNKAMFNVALRILNSSVEAEEVLQDSFLKVFDNIKNYDRRFSFGTWLKRIVINRSLDVLKKRKVNFVPIEEAEVWEEEDEEEIAFDVNVIIKCVQKLPDGYRTILTLFLFEDHSHKEIAGLLGISEGTSKSQYNRARKKLATSVKQNMISHER